MNFLSIFSASIAAFVVAFLWNGPLFGKVRMRLANIQTSPQPKISQIVLNYVVFLITAFIMAMVFWLVFSSPLMGVATWYRGWIMAVWLWLGFNVTATFIEVIWNGRSWKLWLFECAFAFIIFSIMGIILGSF